MDTRAKDLINQGLVDARGLFGRGIRLIASYVRTHPRPFLISVSGP